MTSKENNSQMMEGYTSRANLLSSFSASLILINMRSQFDRNLIVI